MVKERPSDIVRIPVHVAEETGESSTGSTLCSTTDLSSQSDELSLDYSLGSDDVGGDVGGDSRFSISPINVEDPSIVFTIDDECQNVPKLVERKRLVAGAACAIM